MDGITRVRHRVGADELLAGRRAGDYHALCGVRVLAASLTDRGSAVLPGVRPMIPEARAVVPLDSRLAAGRAL